MDESVRSILPVSFHRVEYATPFALRRSVWVGRRKLFEISGNYRGVDVTVAPVLAEGEARAYQPQSSITVQ
jgi:hypothetical protein